MDPKLKERLEEWEESVNLVADIESDYFALDAEEKTVYSKLFLEANGKTIAEREALAYAHQVWSGYKSHHAKTKANYNQMRRLLDLKQKAYEAEYITYKIENDVIKRQL